MAPIGLKLLDCVLFLFGVKMKENRRRKSISFPYTGMVVAIVVVVVVAS
ncbi:hypothetical protein CFP56_020461 [Quercus suber]|uniref:Uncharacterized protein n=1 Tax=Quercus suber TaxID=58331 RepID=A0AAW0LZ89_QUESU